MAIATIDDEIHCMCFSETVVQILIITIGRLDACFSLQNWTGRACCIQLLCLSLFSIDQHLALEAVPTLGIYESFLSNGRKLLRPSIIVNFGRFELQAARANQLFRSDLHIEKAVRLLNWSW